MSKGFEFFEGTATTDETTPRIRVRKGGQIIMNKAALTMLGEGITHVQLGFNPKSKAVGIRGAKESAKGRYTLRSQKNSSSRLIGGKKFFVHHGLEVEKATAFDAEDLGNQLVGFKMVTEKK